MLVENPNVTINSKEASSQDEIPEVDPSILGSPKEQVPRKRIVTFNEQIEIKQIPRIPRNPSETKVKFEVKDKTIIINRRHMKLVKTKARKYYVLVPGPRTVTLKYRRKEDLDADLRGMGLKSKTYVENKILIYNLGFRENEDTVKEYFSSFGEVEKVILEKNKGGHCTGKATVTFKCNFVHDAYRLNGRLLRVEIIKKQIINKTRLFISQMNKKTKIADLRSILKRNGFVPKNIRIDIQDGKNKGYGFVEFERCEEASLFLESFKGFSKQIGENAFVEMSKEKDMK